MTYAGMSSQPAQLFFKSKITFITSIVVISGMKILFTTVYSCKTCGWYWNICCLLVEVQLKQKKVIKFLSNHLTIANYFIVDRKYVFLLVLIRIFSNNVSQDCPGFLNVIFIYFELIAVIVNLYISQI